MNVLQRKYKFCSKQSYMKSAAFFFLKKHGLQVKYMPMDKKTYSFCDRVNRRHLIKMACYDIDL